MLCNDYGCRCRCYYSYDHTVGTYSYGHTRNAATGVQGMQLWGSRYSCVRFSVAIITCGVEFAKAQTANPVQLTCVNIGQLYI